MNKKINRIPKIWDDFVFSKKAGAEKMVNSSYRKNKDIVKKAILIWDEEKK